MAFQEACSPLKALQVTYTILKRIHDFKILISKFNFQNQKFKNKRQF